MQDTNSMQDEIRKQHEKLKNQPLSKRLDYFWEYYKIHTILVVITALVLGGIFHAMLTHKQTVLSVAYINAFPNVADDVFMEDFNRFLGIDEKKQETLLDSSYYINESYDSPYAATYEQKFSAIAMSGRLDAVVSDEAYFERYSNEGFFQDLSLILTPEELASYSDRLYYCDLPNDDQVEPVPVGIEVTDAAKIQSTASYPNAVAYFGIVTGSKFTDNGIAFLHYLETE